MLPIQRHREILNRLHVSGIVRVSELARSLAVTEETIRRDLDKLETDGKLMRTYGGAAALGDQYRELPFEQRSTLNLDQKKAIAVCAVSYVEEGDVIAMDASSTACEMAMALRDIPLTLITNSVTVCATACSQSRIAVISTGGFLDRPSVSYVGMLAEQALESFHFGKLFLSCKGIDTQRGLSVADESHARIKKRMIELADSVYLLADSSKFGLRAARFFASITDVDVLITDQQADPDFVSLVNDLGVEVVIAECRSRPS